MLDSTDLNELYFNIGPTDLPNFHRFLRALSPRRRGFIKRLNLDLSTVESVAPILRLLERFTAIESLTLGFPRGHDDLREGMLVWKLDRRCERHPDLRSVDGGTEEYQSRCSWKRGSSRRSAGDR